eukprot:scaffold38856_cov60-Phaeocystis_antarctica.AAC.4
MVAAVATGFHFDWMCVSAGFSAGLPIEAKAASLVPTGAVERGSERERRDVGWPGAEREDDHIHAPRVALAPTHTAQSLVDARVPLLEQRLQRLLEQVDGVRGGGRELVPQLAWVAPNALRQRLAGVVEHADREARRVHLL